MFYNALHNIPLSYENVIIFPHFQKQIQTKDPLHHPIFYLTL